MRNTNKSFAALAAGLLVCSGTAMAADHVDQFKGEAKGVYVNVDTVDIKIYHNEDYYEYLGKGYIPLLEAAKSAGHIVDFGVLERQTGSAEGGNVLIWYSAESMAKLEQANEFMNDMTEDMYSDSEWAEMFKKVAGVRKPVSSNVLREVSFSKME